MMLTEFWYSHFPIFSILLPAFTGIALVLLGNPGAGSLLSDWRQPIRHGISWFSAASGLVLALFMLDFASSGQIKSYELSEWTAPFGIVLVVDRLAALMIVLTYSLALPILWFASSYWDVRGRYFHSMFHFLLMGLCGAFLTGDLFNLFVFFEILLMSSYVLLLHHHSTARFKLGLHYVIINLLASALFLIGLGLIYGSVGSLNMADVARIFPTLDSDVHQLALTGAMLLFVVFAIKAAILPLGFWLPKTYAVAVTPVAAIFALMTKVGIYAILRVNAGVFADSQGQYLLEQWLLVLGILSTGYGVIGALAAERLRRFIGFMMLSSIGTIIIGIALFNPHAWAAALYYMVHSTLIAAIFYLLAEWISDQRGSVKDQLLIAPRMKQHRLLGLLYLLVALMITGLPPFSGFLGKVFLLQATLHHHGQLGIILVVLLVSLFSILTLVRIGFILFWRASEEEEEEEQPSVSASIQPYQQFMQQQKPRLDKVIYLFLLLLIAYAACAEPIYRYMLATAQQIQNQPLYQQHLLKTDPSDQVISIEPFDSHYLPVLKDAPTVPDQYQKYIPYTIAAATLAGAHIPTENSPPPSDNTAVLPDHDAKLEPMEQH